MRKAGRWMRIEDDRILEVLNERGSATPHVITCEFRYAMLEGIVHDRCERLAQAGFVAADSQLGRYELTRKGAEYLRGELDAAHHAPGLRSRVRYGSARSARVY